MQEVLNETAEATDDLEKVLVVDDDPDILSAMKLVLEDAGYEVIESRDGNDALEQYKIHKPKLIVLDAMLPKRSGFLVLEKIKAHTRKQDIPYVIMITGNQGRRHKEWALSLGVSEYLAKPFKLDTLTELVDKYKKIIDSN